MHRNEAMMSQQVNRENVIELIAIVEISSQINLVFPLMVSSLEKEIDQGAYVNQKYRENVILWLIYGYDQKIDTWVILNGYIHIWDLNSACRKHSKTHNGLSFLLNAIGCRLHSWRIKAAL